MKLLKSKDQIWSRYVERPLQNLLKGPSEITHYKKIGTCAIKMCLLQSLVIYQLAKGMTRDPRNPARE